MSLAVLLWVFIIPALCGLLFTWLTYETFDGMSLNMAFSIGFFSIIPTLGYIMPFIYFGTLLHCSEKQDFRSTTPVGKFFYDSYK